MIWIQNEQFEVKNQKKDDVEDGDDDDDDAIFIFRRSSSGHGWPRTGLAPCPGDVPASPMVGLWVAYGSPMDRPALWAAPH